MSGSAQIPVEERLVPGRVPADHSLPVLLASNLLTIVVALVQDWDLNELMWIYWGQSLIIGYFNVQRILGLEKFSTQGFRINNHAVAPTRRTQRETAIFFALHYGLFHLVYGVFLVGDSAPGDSATLVMVLVCTGAFYLNHRYSFRYHRARDRARVPNIGSIMFFPYLRIIPMHLTIIFGHALAGQGHFSLLLFLLLKTAADLAMHLVEHDSR